MRLERARGERVECGHKYDRRHVRRPDLAHHVEARHPRHLDVEKDKRRLQRPHRAHGILPVAALADDLELRVRIEQLADPPPRQRLVVDDQC